MGNCLAVVFNFGGCSTTFHLVKGQPDTLSLMAEHGLSTEEFFRQRDISAEKAREAFPDRFAPGGNEEPLTWVAPLGIVELHRQKASLQKLANMLGLPIFVFRRRSTESPHLEFQLESRTLR